MVDTLEFKIVNTVVVNIAELAEELEGDIPQILADYQGLTFDELEAIDLEDVKKAVAKKWLEE